MGFKIPTGIKAPFEQLPTGYVLFNIDEIIEGDLGKEGDPCYGWLVKLTAVAPDEVNGLSRDERFFLGIRPGDKRVQDGRAQADPMAESDETLRLTMGRVKAFAEAAGLPNDQFEGQDSDAIQSALKNRKVLGKVEHKILPARPGQPQSDMPFAQVGRWLPKDCGIEPHVQPEAPIGGKGAVASAGPLPNGGQVATAPTPAPAPAAPAPAPRAAGRAAPARIGAR